MDYLLPPPTVWLLGLNYVCGGGDGSGELWLKEKCWSEEVGGERLWGNARLATNQAGDAMP